eukprot:753661-Hanusia_phi.AAC.3
MNLSVKSEVWEDKSEYNCREKLKTIMTHLEGATIEYKDHASSMKDKTHRSTKPWLAAIR